MENLSSKVWKYVLGLILATCSLATAQNYSFTTIVGNEGYGSADGVGNTARFNGPYGLAFDGSGNLFVTDNMNQTIRKLTSSGDNWVVSTIAGSPHQIGSANGTNETARFNGPSGITVDASGNLFVTDANNQTVRKITQLGGEWIVTTIAGLAETFGFDDGTNSNARFNNPSGVATDTNGSVLITDTANSLIRKITPSGNDWIVLTLAGLAENPGDADGTNAAALFNGSIGIARDGAGNFYVADSGSHIIRKVVVSGTNGIVTTIAGLANTPGDANGTNSAARFNGPAGLALDSVGNIYVSEYGNNMIRKIAPSGTNWIVTTIAGNGMGGFADGTNGSATFYYPYGVAVDASGNVFVADFQYNLIRRISPSGPDWITTTIAGRAGGSGKVDGTNFNAKISSPYGAVADAAGNVYFADSGNYTIRKLAKIGSDWVVNTIAGLAGFSGTADGTNNEARFFGPYGVTMDAQTNLYVADLFGHTIRKIRPEGTNWITTTIAGQIGGLGSYADGTNQDAHFIGPEGIAADTNGNLFVTDTFGQTIRKMTRSGTNWITTTIAGQNGAIGSADGTNSFARFKNPVGIVAVGSSNVFVADSGNHSIRKLTSSGTNWIVTTIAGLNSVSGSDDGTNQTARFQNPFSLALNPDGSLTVADMGNNIVRKITPSGTNWITTTIGGMAGEYGVVDGIGDAARFPGFGGIAVNSSNQIFLFCYASVILGELTTAVAPLPILQIKLVGNRAVLFWPQSASDFNLETTSPLKPGATWTNRPGAILTGTNFWFTNTLNGGSEFFRLRKP